jgi:hypothetical protein
MIGVLHPVGPETAGTYWARRACVTGITIVLGGVLVLINNGMGSGSAAQASLVDPSVTSTPSVILPSPLETAVGAPSAIGISSTSPAPESPTPTPSAKKKAQRNSLVSCRTKDLRATLTGRIRLAPRQRAAFQLSLINASNRTCVAKITRKNFELKISSRNSRIWSTNDCPAAINAISHKLSSDHAVAWSLRWNGKRSKAGCAFARQAPKPGSYVATAHLDGVAPVKLRMIMKARV